jgi:hypothetical protein
MSLFSRNNNLRSLEQMGDSQDFVMSTRQIIKIFKDTGLSQSRAGKIEKANRRVQFNTFIQQNKQVISDHEHYARAREERDSLRRSRAANAADTRGNINLAGGVRVEETAATGKD